MLLNVVNTTGEYLVARLLTLHVRTLARGRSRLQQAGVHRRLQRRLSVLGQRRPRFVLQAFVASRLVKYHGPARRAAGAAADRARRLRDHRGRRRLLGRALDQDGGERDRLLDHEHGAPAALAADDRARRSTRRSRRSTPSSSRTAMCSRRRSSISAPRVLHLTVQQFAIVNIALTLVWLGDRRDDCCGRSRQSRSAPRRQLVPRQSPLAADAAARARECRWRRNARRAARRRARREGDRSSTRTCRLRSSARSTRIDRALVHAAHGLHLHRQRRSRAAASRSAPATARDTATPDSFDAHAAWSIRNYKAVDAALTLPAHGRRSRNVGRERQLAGRAARRVLRPRQRFGGRATVRTSCCARRPSEFRAAFVPRRLLAFGGGVDIDHRRGAA